MTTKIGVLCVHGIGQQLPGTTADDFAASIAKSLGENFDSSVEIYDHRPAVIRLCSKLGCDNPPLEIYVHEVHWADLDDPQSWWSMSSFWWWGFSQWARYEPMQFKLPGAKKSMDTKGVPQKASPTVRAQLFAAAALFCMAGLLIRAIMKVIEFIPALGGLVRWICGHVRPVATVVEYAGDVRLYVTDGPSKDPLERRDYMPRVAIRRRAIRAVVDIARSGYDRWYIAAHSLGSVVAFNALMETEEALPNYLSPAMYRDLKDAGWLVEKPGSQPAEMMPDRPSYVDNDVVLCRKKMFEKLWGFFTYGSPLDKFYELWRPITPINMDTRVFNQNFRWINVYEDLDPIGASLDDLSLTIDDPNGNVRVEPSNFGYRTSHLLGVAHNVYMGARAQPSEVARAVTDWITTGDQFKAPDGRIDVNDKPPAQWRVYAQAGIVALVMALAAGGLTAWSFGDWLLEWAGSGWLPQVLTVALIYLIGSIVIVALTGVIDTVVRKCRPALPASRGSMSQPILGPSLDNSRERVGLG